MRQLMFRNYPNLLTGFYIYRPDEPLSTATEPLDDTTPPTYRPLYAWEPITQAPASTGPLTLSASTTMTPTD